MGGWRKPGVTSPSWRKLFQSPGAAARLRQSAVPEIDPSRRALSLHSCGPSTRRDPQPGEEGTQHLALVGMEEAEEPHQALTPCMEEGRWPCGVALGPPGLKPELARGVGGAGPAPA